MFTLQYNYDKTTWKLIKIRKWYSKLWRSENIAYMYVHNENFWGRKLLKFCGYSWKCSMQSLVYIFCWQQQTIDESLLHKNLFSTNSWKFSPAKFPALQHVFGPNRYQHLSNPLFRKLLVVVYFLLCANQSLYITMNDFESCDCTLANA